jgi:dihydrofolate reductase/thymidylate synthase
MTINIIASVANYKNRLAIGMNGNLLVHLSEDLKFFKNVTTNRLSKDSKLDKNVVLMGRKTWFSIPREMRPLKDRLNLVLTNDKDLRKISPFPKKFYGSVKYDKNVYFISYDEFLDFYNTTNANVFVIGGSDIYNLFLGSENKKIVPSNVFFTEIQGYKPELGLEPDIFINNLSEEYCLISTSEKHYENNISFRFLEYRYIEDFKTDETKYLNMLREILYNGNTRDDRTGVGTISVFGKQLEFDISQSIPLFTTKRVPWKHAIQELLWFMRGDTDAKILQKQGVKIWDGNTSREFLDKRGLQHYDVGILGPGYGWQWRFFGGKYSQAFADTSNIDRSKVGGFDQLQYVENLLKTDPFSRRIMMSYWNPTDFEQTALLPCFPSGTLILTNNGYKPIEDVLLTDKLFTHKGNWKDIINLQQKQYNDEMFEFKLRYNSKCIKATKEHPFLVKDIIQKSDKTIIGYSEDVYWCNAENITKNQVMCLPINKNKIIPSFHQIKNYNGTRSETIIKTITDEDEWFMLGFYMGDGWIDKKKKGCFSFCINKIDDSRFNIYKKISNILHLTYKDETDKLTRYICCNASWWEILKDFGHLAHNKKIPEWIQDAPKEYIQWFINGYITADGCKTENHYESFTTVSADLAYGFQRLYAKLGKILSVSYQKRPSKKLIEGRIVNQRNTYHMRIIKKNKCKYVSNIDENYIYFNILNIDKRIENTQVYNFEVADDNSYTVQNISVHNCHFTSQFYVTEKGGEKYLSCHFVMRSNDMFLGNPFNIFSYAVLTYILAMRCNMKPDKLVYTVGDAHIYKNHLNQIAEQLTRNPRPFPKLKLNHSIVSKPIEEITIDDFDLVGYFPHSSIIAPMAV